MASRLARYFGTGLLLRRLLAELTALRKTIELQTQLLARLTDRVAPEAPAADLAVTRRDSGLDHLNTAEAVEVADYVMRCEADLGHTPTEDQILRYLADQKTTDLHARLALREEDLGRLQDEAAEKAARRGHY